MNPLHAFLKWAAFCTMALVTTVGVCWWLIPDEPINPEAARFVAQPTIPPSEKNASFMLWGLPASPELDAYSVGKRIVAAQDRLEAAQKDSSVFRREDYLGANPLSLEGTKPLCNADQENCLQVYQSNAVAIENEIASRTIYLERWRKIRTLEEFASPNSKITTATSIPDWHTAMRVSEWVSAQVALDMRLKDKQRAALTELATDMATWRRALATHDWVVGQMVAIVSLHRKYRLASEIMNAYPDVVSRFPELMQAIAAPIALADATLLTSARTEARIRMQHLWDLGGEGRTSTQWLYAESPTDFLKPFALRVAYQPQATLNEAFTVFRMSMAHLDQSPKDYLASDAAFRQKLEDLRRFRPLDIFYNPAGRLDVGEGLDFDLSRWHLRLVDMVGLTRLVALQRHLIADKVQANQVVQALSAYKAELLDPYTEKPMQWNAASSQLSFELHGKRFANFGFVDVALPPSPR